ncbi:MAG: DUF1674 domain-containing protein [Proteobacteria bacterium]|nr:DUF1674 domain-containing protein [Pseudomonadota bacterium]
MPTTPVPPLDPAAPAAPRGRVASPAPASTGQPAPPPREIGGREGLEPTRYGDWEKAGRCIDF